MKIHKWLILMVLLAISSDRVLLKKVKTIFKYPGPSNLLNTSLNKYKSLQTFSKNSFLTNRNLTSVLS